MNAAIGRGSDRLAAQSERIRQDLQRLEKDRSAWAREREEKDLADLMDDLKSVERDVGPMLTDCVCVSSRRGEEAPKVVFRDLHEIFVCLDTLFNGLKKARLQLDRAYIRDALLDHIEINYSRFAKLIVKVQRHLDAPQSHTDVPPEEGGVHLPQKQAATV